MKRLLALVFIGFTLGAPSTASATEPSAASAQANSLQVTENKRNVDGNIWVSAGGMLPSAVRVEFARYRWQTFQMGALMVFFRPKGFNDQVELGGGVMGLGAKMHLDQSATTEIGFMTWPLSLSYSNADGGSYRSLCGLAQYCSNDTWSANTYGFLHTAAYFAVNTGSVQFSVGVQMPALWYASYSDSRKGFYKERVPFYAFAAVGF